GFFGEQEKKILLRALAEMARTVSRGNWGDERGAELGVVQQGCDEGEGGVGVAHDGTPTRSQTVTHHHGQPPTG
ncbi:MAG TPA: hypothetical protein VI248_07475, partial [Kineosporiaceae bacterium]